MNQIELINVRKDYTTKTLGTVTAVNNFNLTIKKGECFSFLGPSGCGKTTTLRMLAGFEDLSEGEIRLEGKVVSNKAKNLYVPPEHRNLGMVFQAFAVWPHLNVFDNVAFPLQVQKRPKAEIEERVNLALKQTNLLDQAKVFPSDLSGGEQQRIALARSIVVNPGILLLDEPLSNLDPKLRESMRFEIKRLQKEYNFTIVFVTHDQSEALALSDRLLVMNKGEIIQIGTPQELYNKPVNLFVHNFLGESNFTKVVYRDGKVYAAGDTTQPLPCDIKHMDKAVKLATRPSEIEINHESGIKTKITKRIILSEYTEYYVSLGTQELKIQAPHHQVLAVGDECYIRLVNPVYYDAEERNLTHAE